MIGGSIMGWECRIGEFKGLTRICKCVKNRSNSTALGRVGNCFRKMHKFQRQQADPSIGSLREARKFLEIVVLPPPSRIHHAFHAIDTLRRLQPFTDLFRLAVIVPGDDLFESASLNVIRSSATGGSATSVAIPS
jgi:hypothetical protein